MIALLAGPLVLVPLAGMAILALHGLAIQPGLRSAIEHTQRTSAQKHATLVETLTGIEGVKAQGAEGYLQRRWEQLSAHIAHWDIRSRILTSSATNLSAFVIQTSTIAIVVYGVYRITALEMTMGSLIATVLLTSRALTPVAQLSALATRYYQTRSALTALDRVMALPREEQDLDSSMTPPTLCHSISFSKVSFAYPGQQGLALNDVSLAVNAGEKIAILGRIGSGKSTLQKLLMQFFIRERGRSGWIILIFSNSLPTSCVG